MRLRRAALLLPDPSSELFVPWALTGYDRTTQHRLRLPEEAILALTREQPDSIAFADRHARTALRPYVSKREAESEEQPVLFLISAAKRVLAVLVISDSPYQSEEPTVLKIILSAISDTASRLIYEYRERRFDSSPTRVIFSEHELFTEAIPVLKQQQQPLLLIRVHAGSVLDAVAGRYDEADRYRIMQDVLRITGAMVGSDGIVCELDGGAVLLVLPRGNETDGNLITHQLALGIRHIFKELDTLPELFPHYRIQGERESVEEALADAAGHG